MPDLCFIAAHAALKILIFPLGVLEVEQGLITLSIPLSAQELDRSKPAPVSKKGCKLECPEENLRIYSRAMKSTKCHPWNRVLMEKHSRIPVSLPQPPGNHRALDTVVAQDWATSSVLNTKPGLLMPFCVAAV